MLWLCISLPQLPLEALHTGNDDTVVVVTACEGSARWVICCSPTAEQASLQAPMNYTIALAVHPQLTMLNRKLRAEQAALERLAAWAYQFSSTVILGEIQEELRLARTACLWLEIDASLTLFGGFRSFIEALEAQLRELSYSYQLGIGPTLEGAALLARTGIRLAIHTPHALFTRIRHLPIGKLALAPDITSQLHIAGVRTISSLLELPRAAVAKRFGPEISQFLDQLMGEAADPRPAFRLPEKYTAHHEFEFGVKNTEALLFPLRRMLHEFVGYLRGRDTGVQRFAVAFGHRQVPATELRIGASTPERNMERLFSLVRERLERTQLPAPTVSLSVRADEFAMPTALQTDLLSRAQQQTEEFSHTIDRLAARLGDENVHGLQLMAEHRPETSWQACAIAERPVNLSFPDRPLWLLPEPRPLQVATSRIASGPERIETGWWEGADVQRDYYVVHMSNGPDLWVFRDLSNSNWYLHGFWS